MKKNLKVSYKSVVLSSHEELVRHFWKVLARYFDLDISTAMLMAELSLIAKPGVNSDMEKVQNILYLSRKTRTELAQKLKIGEGHLNNSLTFLVNKNVLVRMSTNIYRISYGVLKTKLEGENVSVTLNFSIENKAMPELEEIPKYEVSITQEELDNYNRIKEPLKDFLEEKITHKEFIELTVKKKKKKMESKDNGKGTPFKRLDEVDGARFEEPIVQPVVSPYEGKRNYVQKTDETGSVTLKM